jgi:transcriptional regulator with XRE-family HTH domain
MDAVELKRRREKAQLTQAKLAEKVGLSVTMLSHYETERWPIPKIAQKALDNVLKEAGA